MGRGRPPKLKRGRGRPPKNPVPVVPVPASLVGTPTGANAFAAGGSYEAGGFGVESNVDTKKRLRKIRFRRAELFRHVHKVPPTKTKRTWDTEDMGEEDVDWDFRRKLAEDLCHLSSPDLSGLLIRLYADSSVKLLEIPRNDDAHMDTAIDLENLSDHTIRMVRKYVDDCYVPTVVYPKDCVICEGCWSSEKVIACANETCPTRVHEACYGTVIRRDPLGPWYCPSCEHNTHHSCVLCLRTGLDLKKTSNGKWAHVLCSLVVPETCFNDCPTLEPIEGIEAIESTRYRVFCCLCRKRGGVGLVCAHPDCTYGFHPRCAADAGYLIGSKDNPFAIFCAKHIPHDHEKGARRWISVQDLLPRARNTFIEDEDADYSFILESSAFPDFAQKSYVAKKMKGGRKHDLDRIEVGPIEYAKKRFKLTSLSEPSSNSVFITPTPPPRPVTPMETLPLPGPPPLTVDTVPHIIPQELTAPTASDLPPFPTGKELIGGIVEIFWRSTSQWYAAEVIEWSSRNRNYQVRYLLDSFEEWTSLREHTCRVIREPENKSLLIKVERVREHGVFLYRHKALVYAPEPVTQATTPLSPTESAVSDEMDYD